ncbi:aerobic-type carbon monoxide dehydrogenase, middle subunit CoxM/CutM-like protein [Saccharomonospora marina XMU15]|uniref:Aerobic-type carbon monoxide dehydrogenase, middle subunit CoxM/CutM-like protein n=1 Tax=Saccharomonospora marina XMU15 TaxID=882083 RepID=H5WWB2_9PSEU|nr:xanthine dehydrogenase family protein subunit M [Saccharomonospora marina]EHR49394.1 aerobic-type carbon monoxide dehydrogenase, middle subunit CoxM/CutM-like protein [Saccharomonospora marina XMU15]
MKAFGYTVATSAAEAVRIAAGTPNSAFIAGGTDLLNLMKDSVQVHDRLVDVNRLDIDRVTLDGEALRIGGLARMRQVAEHPGVRRTYPVLSEALLASASPQVRNMASIGGNLLQRTRCGYFRDTGSACNKREPGTGCPAIEGHSRGHAILGGSEACIATHPSDLAVALTALDATVHVLGPGGARTVPIADFYLLPGDTPQRETAVRPGELITRVDVPRTPVANHSGYLKLRDRASFEFAVVSVAAAVRMSGRVVRDVRLAFGGVGTRAWRDPQAEAVLRGGLLTKAAMTEAGRVLVRDAQPRKDNEFKVELVQRALVSILSELGGIR